MKKILLLAALAFCFVIANSYSMDEEKWVNQQWSDEDWSNDYRDVYYYENDMLKMLVFQVWDGAEWSDQTRFIHEYDSEGREISYLIQFHDSEGWYDYMKDEYFYEDDKLVKYLLWYGGENREPFEVDSEIIYFYNEDGTTKKTETYRYNAEERILYEEDTFSYDEMDRMIELISKKYDFILEGLKNNYREILSYVDDIEFAAETTDQKWTNDQWTNFQKEIYTFGDDKLWDDHIIQVWGEDWENVTKVLIERNENDQETNLTTQIWAENQEWLNSNRKVTEYNEDNKPIRRLEQIYLTDMWYNDKEDLYYYSDNRRYMTVNRMWIDGEWANYKRTFLEGWLGTQDNVMSDLRLKVIPNPASNQISISFSLEKPSYIDARIISINGNNGLVIINDTAMPGELNFDRDISDLPIGAYFLSLSIEGKRYIRKFIVSR